MNKHQKGQQFQPFDALKGFKEALKKQEQQKIEKPILSEDQENKINEMLLNLKIQDKIELRYYDNNQILNILNILQTEYSNKMSNYYLVMKNLIYSIMILSSRQVSSKEVRMVSPTELIKDYVSLHYSEHNILDQISETSYYSKQYLSSRFKSDTGLTFKSYLQQVRCGAAEHLMNCTNMSIPEISEAVGYNDIKYFQNIFKKHNGVSPKQLKMHFNKINNRKNES